MNDISVSFNNNIEMFESLTDWGEGFPPFTHHIFEEIKQNWAENHCRDREKSENSAKNNF